MPQKYFVEKIGGDLVDVSVLVPPGSSPHTYEPRPAQMMQLAHAKIFFAAGVEFEQAWLPRIRQGNPQLTIVYADSGITKMPMPGLSELQKDSSESSSPGEERGGEDETGLDPHTWLSPQLVKEMAPMIARTLIRFDPADSGYFTQGRNAFIDTIGALQKELHAILDTAHRKTFMVFHPAWGYFAREFGLREIPVEIQGKEPSARELTFIIDIAKRNNIRTIFIQPQFSPQTAETIARQIGARTVVANPEAEDWANSLREFAREMSAN
jgi:zinc transport system substrate-binding protein